MLAAVHTNFVYIRQLLVEGRQDEAVGLARYRVTLDRIGGFIDCLVVGTDVITAKRADGAALSSHTCDWATH